MTVAAAAFASRVDAQCRYAVEAVIQPPPCPITGPPPIWPKDMNDQGVVVGYFGMCLDSDNEAFRWSAIDGFQTLPRPADSQGARAHAVNDRGQIVGHIVRNNLRMAALWDGPGMPLELGIVPGGVYSDAHDINDDGVIVGETGNTNTGDPPIQAFRWHEGVLESLAPMLTGPRSVARTINDHGDVAGWTGVSPVIDGRAFILLDNGYMIDVGVVPGGYTGDVRSMNAQLGLAGTGRVERQGKFGGWSLAFDGDPASIVALPPVSPYVESQSLDINAVGQVVGRMYSPAGPLAAMVVTNHELTELHPLAGAADTLAFGQGVAIDTAGDILVDATILPNQSAFVLLQPVGRPATDIDGDCGTGLADLELVISHWAETDSPADVDDNGMVDVFDLVAVILNWGQ